MRLFISHGLDKKVRSDMRFLDTLAPALEAAGHQMLLDRAQLEAGDTWQDVLHEMLAECDAAVLLLSPRALTRPWVLKESTVLAYRRALEPRFPIYPVLLGGVAASDLVTGHFSPLCIDAVQGLQPGDPLHPASIDAAAARRVAKALVARLASWQRDAGAQPPATPLDKLELALKARIRRVSDLPALQALCEQLTGRPLRWRPGAGAAAEPARLIAALLAGGLAARTDTADGGLVSSPLARLVADLFQQCGLGRDDAQVVLSLLAPLWVRPDAAALLADVAGRNRLPAAAGQAPPPGLSVALSCVLPDFSADHHVRRLLMPTSRGTVVRTLVGGHSDNRLDDLKAQVRNEYRRLVQHGTAAAALPPALVDSRLAKTDKPLAIAETVFFVIPDPVPDAALLAELQACFPRQTFILHSAGPLPDPLPPRVLALPALDADHELAMAEDQSAAHNLIAG